MGLTPKFAPDYPRITEADDNRKDLIGCIQFPADQTERKQLFVQESMEHPAKANISMVKALVEFTSNHGDLVVDIFGGTGTILVAEQMDRTVGMIELNDRYYDIIQMNQAKTSSTKSFVIKGANQLVLPALHNIQSIITSPPYAGAMSGSGQSGMQKELVTTGTSEALQTYGHSAEDAVQGNLMPYNLAGYNNFMFAQEMRKLYKLSYDSLKPGGYLCIIIKDRIRAGIKDELGKAAFDAMRQVGFTPDIWERWAPPGSAFTKSHRFKGRRVIEDEHLIVMKKIT